MKTMPMYIGAMKIKIKYFSDDVPRLHQIDNGDWIDVYAAETVVIHKGEHKLIPLGFACQLPKGFEAHLLPRSSTYKKWGIIMANNTGIIDNSYCGDNDQWMFSAICLNTNGFVAGEPVSFIAKGDKIAQFRIVESMPPVEFEEVTTLGNSDRGGFGSTGAR